MDKVKAQATAASVMAKDAAQKGQTKLGEVQSKKSADATLKDLGAAYYATRTGRATPTTEADIERLVVILQEHESEHGALTLAPESTAGNPTVSPDGPPMASSPATPPPTAASPSSPPPPASTVDPSSPPPPPPTAQTI
ncbi:MAG TPA: hypothetical protein VMQ59_13315 [Acidimicrobiales bacterium]|nr:hypothetical protein [Acidimicrobiales bacterium]